MATLMINYINQSKVDRLGTSNQTDSHPKKLSNQFFKRKKSLQSLERIIHLT